MQTVPVEQAAGRLAEIIERLAPGEEVVITRDDQPVARLVGETQKPQPRPRPGLGKGMITVVADDDEHLKDFAEYMP